ncbi:MAG: hypothetical protein HW421_3789 [Ignavibacteria bacterium]|nr:hypothetical protein [Ignavibacteria bacterium]
MKSLVITNMSMDTDFTSDWQPFSLQSIPGVRKQANATSIIIQWFNAEGEMNGDVEIHGTNDLNNIHFSRIYPLETDSGSGSLTIILFPVYEFIRIKYLKNGITGGVLNASINYE